jgi:hypothetical protein
MVQKSIHDVFKDDPVFFHVKKDDFSFFVSITYGLNTNNRPFFHSIKVY